MRVQRVRIRKPWNPLLSPLVCRLLDELGIRWGVETEDGHGAIIIEMDGADDARLLAVWDELSDLRVRYIDARQRSIGIQTSFLEGEQT